MHLLTVSIIHRNFEKTVQAAYQWLSDNYEDGDCIFLFGKSRQFRLVLHHFSLGTGFSRGAFQVRALSAMIHKVRSPLHLANLVLKEDLGRPHSQGERDADTFVSTSDILNHP